MNANQVLEVVEKVLLRRELTPLEELVLLRSWQGLGYRDMAEDSGYDSNYFKEIGSHLWHQLSDMVGKRVTKKNLQLVLKQYDTVEDKSNNTQFSKQVINNDFSESIKPEMQYPGSPLSFDSKFYINRPPIEKLACAEIHKPGCIVRIQAPRRMGKSSLTNRVVAHAQSFGYRTVFIDFHEADDAIFASLNKFLRWFCANVSTQLNLIPKLDDYWDEDIGCKVSSKMYFEKYLLKQIDTPLVLVFNEVNRVFEHHNIFKDFFPMLRFWHEMAQQVEIWQKLRIVIVHCTETYIQFKLNQSSFNIGLAINLRSFTLEQVQELAQCYGFSWKDNNNAQELMKIVGGHPYLINVALYHLSHKEITFSGLLQTAHTQSGIYSLHLRSLLVMVKWETELASALRQVMSASHSIELEAMIAYKLESLGLIELQENQARPSCNLYRIYFLKELTAEWH